MAQRVLVFECDAGISADMALGALIALGADAEIIAREVAKAVPEPFQLKAKELHKNGIDGIDVEIITGEAHAGHAHQHEHSHKHHHAHMTYSQVCALIQQAGLTPGAENYALAIFTVLGKAEASVHEQTLAEVAFHEVGSPASLIDIIGTAVAADFLGADDLYCTSLHDGCGTIECAHGIIPVPVPAVAEMAKSSGIPIIIDEDITTEMVTPSGYAILNGLGAIFTPDPVIEIQKIGYGFGKRDTGKSGALKATLGEVRT